MKKATFLSIVLTLITVLPAIGHEIPSVKLENIQFKTGCTYQIRYMPIGTHKVSVITFSKVGEVRMLGMREMLPGTTPDGEKYYIPVDFILDIKEIKRGKPLSAETP